MTARSCGFNSHLRHHSSQLPMADSPTTNRPFPEFAITIELPVLWGDQDAFGMSITPYLFGGSSRRGLLTLSGPGWGR